MDYLIYNNGNTAVLYPKIAKFMITALRKLESKKPDTVQYVSIDISKDPASSPQFLINCVVEHGAGSIYYIGRKDTHSVPCLCGECPAEAETLIFSNTPADDPRHTQHAPAV